MEIVVMLLHLSRAALKRQAKLLAKFFAAEGVELKHSRCLEAIAQSHGYRNWRTAQALLPEDLPLPQDLTLPEPHDGDGATFQKVFTAASIEDAQAPRFHSILPDEQCTGDILPNRQDFFGGLLAGEGIAGNLGRLFVRYREESGKALPDGVDDWAQALDELALIYAREAHPAQQIDSALELIAESTSPFTLKRKVQSIWKRADVEVLDSNFKSTQRFLYRFNPENPSGAYLVEWFNELQDFAKWFCGGYGVEAHAAIFRFKQLQ